MFRSKRIFRAPALVACLLVAVNSLVAAEPPVDEYLRELHKTPNWQVFTPEYLDVVARRREKLQGAPVTVLGTVTTENDRAIQGALVVLRIVSNNSSNLRKNGVVEDVFASTWTDANGVFKFRNHPTPWREPVNTASWEICVFANGFAAEFKQYDRMDGRVRLERIRLSPGNTIRGRIVDRVGVPIENADIALTEIIHCWRDDRNGQRFEIESSLMFSELEFGLPIRPDGTFEIGGLPARRTVGIRTQVPGYSETGLQRYYRVATSDDLDRATLLDKTHRRAGLIYPLLDPSFEITASRAIADFRKSDAWSETPARPNRKATIRIVDEGTGEGVKAVGVSAILHKLGNPPYMHQVPQTVTDQNGIATLEIPQTQCHVVCFGRKFGYVTHYERLSTNPEEYTPPVPAEQWVKKIAPGTQPIEISFKVKPVPPLEIRVVDPQGYPVEAEVSVSAPDWNYYFASRDTNSEGLVSIPIRPVLFDVVVRAETKNGKVGEVRKTLSVDLDKRETVTVIVKPTEL